MEVRKLLGNLGIRLKWREEKSQLKKELTEQKILKNAPQVVRRCPIFGAKKILNDCKSKRKSYKQWLAKKLIAESINLEPLQESCRMIYLMGNRLGYYW